MRVAIYCASGDSPNKNYYLLTKELGLYLSSLGYELVYGGSNSGLMGVIADAFLDGGAKVIGVVPDIELIQERTHKGISEYYYTKDMAERRSKMIELADLFIALPGGPGTLDELSEVLDLMRIDIIKEKLIIYNMDSYYDELEIMVKKYFTSGFLKGNELDNLYFVKSLDDIKKVLE